MTLNELREQLDLLAQVPGVDGDSEITIGRYANRGEILLEDLHLFHVDWLYLSADDDHLDEDERKKVIELQAYNEDEA